jgi:peroxiredoxin Q/BCP
LVHPAQSEPAVAVGPADEIERTGFADDDQYPYWPEELATGFKSLAAARQSEFGSGMVLVQTAGMAAELTLKLNEGDKAPAFTAETNGGSSVSLAEFKGKNVILYFYPKDDTPGCTKEACAFRDQYAAFKKRGAVVLGVSVDPVKAHDKFVEKYKLPFTLLADVDKKIVEAYGVWGQKTFMGRKYLGVHRVTFLIGPDGKIKKIWSKVKPEEHAAEVLAAL